MSTLQQQLFLEENDENFIQHLKLSEDQFLKETKELGIPSAQSKFNYAFNLVRSAQTPHNNMGKLLLQQLLEKDINNMEYLYFLAMVCYKLEEYGQARSYTTNILKQEPAHRQGLELQKMIQQKVTNDGITGLLITGGAAAAIAGIAGVLIFALARKRN